MVQLDLYSAASSSSSEPPLPRGCDGGGPGDTSERSCRGGDARGADTTAVVRRRGRDKLATRWEGDQK